MSSLFPILSKLLLGFCLKHCVAFLAGYFNFPPAFRCAELLAAGGAAEVFIDLPLGKPLLLKTEPIAYRPPEFFKYAQFPLPSWDISGECTE